MKIWMVMLLLSSCQTTQLLCQKGQELLYERTGEMNMCQHQPLANLVHSIQQKTFINARHLRVISSYLIRTLVYSLYKNNAVLHEDRRKRE